MTKDRCSPSRDAKERKPPREGTELRVAYDLAMAGKPIETIGPDAVAKHNVIQHLRLYHGFEFAPLWRRGLWRAVSKEGRKIAPHEDSAQA